ncbi:hypothetical protein A2U01_0028949, partial [Trifolium medium]|nr:hypothetical protein [Trifolium medium]
YLIIIPPEKIALPSSRVAATSMKASSRVFIGPNSDQ